MAETPSGHPSMGLEAAKHMDHLCSGSEIKVLITLNPKSPKPQTPLINVTQASDSGSFSGSPLSRNPKGGQFRERKT